MPGFWRTQFKPPFVVFIIAPSRPFLYQPTIQPISGVINLPSLIMQAVSSMELCKLSQLVPPSVLFKRYLLSLLKAKKLRLSLFIILFIIKTLLEKVLCHPLCAKMLCAENNKNWSGRRPWRDTAVVNRASKLSLPGPSVNLRAAGFHPDANSKLRLLHPYQDAPLSPWR